MTLDLVGGAFADYEWFEDDLRRAGRRGPVVSGRIRRRRGVIAQVWDTLDSADIALVPSRAEPFGNVAVEAQLAARPVVASAVQGLNEIIDDGRNGRLVEPGNAVALADSIQAVIDGWDVCAQACDRRPCRGLGQIRTGAVSHTDIADAVTSTTGSSRQ